MSNWTHDNIPSQTGRHAIVTGANTGIGYETARSLALQGADVVLACRSAQRGEDALQRLLAEVPSATASLELLDLSDLGSIEAFATRYRDAHDRLDLLILNAGVMVPPESKTAQGFELQFGVNHLGHFALTGHLLPLIRTTAEARVVVVSSVAARDGVMQFEDLNYERGYTARHAYAQSKLANQLFARELQRRLQAAGASTLVTAAHPGWTATDLQRTAWYFRVLNPFFAMKPPQGALPTLRAATDPGAQGGQYFGPDGWMEVRGYPVVVPMVKNAHDEAAAERLWNVSEELTGVRYAFSDAAAA